MATDHLTGANVITSSVGVVEELADYYPYGEVRLDEKSGTFSEQRKFAGHELDTDTGLSYMNARYYSGKTGRFVSQDPMALYSPEKLLGDPQSLNSYAYARNNPMRYIDPTGEVSMEFWKGLPHQFGVDISNSSRGIAQGFYNLSGDFGEYGIGGKVLGMSSNVLGGVVDNIANVIDPRVSKGDRIWAMGLTVVDVGSGGKGKAAQKLTSNILGKIGEGRLARLVGEGIPHAYHLTEMGRRFIDRQVGKVIHEAKNGYITASKNILLQAEKDAWLMNEKGLQPVWHLFKGGSDNVIKALEDKGIKVINYLPK